MIDQIIGKPWMYNSVVYNFNDFVEVENKIIFSTDRKSIIIKIDELKTFKSNLLPVSMTAAKPQNQLDTTILKDLTDGLMHSFRAVQEAKGEEVDVEIKKAMTKNKIAREVTNVAKIVLNARNED
jgi:hypothetical protein